MIVAIVLFVCGLLLIAYGWGRGVGRNEGESQTNAHLRPYYEQEIKDTSKRAHDAGYKKGYAAGERSAANRLDQLTADNVELHATCKELRRRLARPKPVGVKRASKPSKNFEAERTTPSPAKPRRRKAFTLIELLIVMAIICLLLAMALPVFGRVRENARRSSCQSNLHQLGMATLIYVRDCDGIYPIALIDTQGQSWEDRLQPYIKSRAILLCPDGVGSIPTAGHYGANFLLFHSSPLTNEASVGQAASTIMVIDAGTYEVEPRFYNVPGQLVSTRYIPGLGASVPVYPSLPTIYSHDYTFGRHFGGVNVCYVDGHVRWQRTEWVYNQALTGTAWSVGG